MVKWRIGCSGFHYKHWKGSFYPEKVAQTKWFNYYTEHFKTIELNVTFYRFPRVHVLEDWYKKSPNGFSFSVKAPRLITHYKQFKDAHKWVNDFYGSVREGLKDKLGCTLFQLPSRLTYKEEKLKQIIDHLNPHFKNVVEFRHESWWNQEVYTALSKHNITFCGMSHPELPQNVIQNTRVVYYRFHGLPHLYSSPYNVETLQQVADEINTHKKTKEAFIYFNNDIDTSAIQNARDMEAYVLGVGK